MEYDNEGYPWVSITRHNSAVTFRVPPKFFTGEWSTVAVAVYFHLLMEDDGLTVQGLRHRHPNVSEYEIMTALSALERHGFIEQDIVPCNEMGYVITGVYGEEDGEDDEH